MKKLRSLAILACLMAVGFLSCNLADSPKVTDSNDSNTDSNDDSDDDPDPDTSYETVLRNLGVDVSEASAPRTDINGISLGSDYNPLSSKKRTVLYKQCDLYLAGMRPQSVGSGNDYLSTVGITGLGSMLTQDNDSAWAQSFYNKVVAADVDGDGTDEVIVAVFDTVNNRLILKELSKGSEGYDYRDVTTVSDSNIAATHVSGPDCMGIARGDVDGDGKDEIAMFDSVYTMNGDGKLAYLGGNADQLGEGAFWDGLCFGNVDDDVALELLRLNVNRNAVTAYKFNSASKVAAQYSIAVTATNTGASLNSPTFCMPSIESPAAVLEFTGHEVKVTEPKVIAVLAAPPFYASLGGSTDPGAIEPSLGNAGTLFGKSTGSGNSSDEANGFSFSVSAGFHAEAPLWGSAASTEVKATVENSFDWTTSQSTERTHSYSFTNSTDDDLVVYSIVPVDCYYYKVLNAPSALAIDTDYLVSLPRAPVTTSMARADYNEENGDCFDIDATYMSHTIGLPSSYPTHSEMEAIKAEKPNGLWDVTGLKLGIGTNTQEISIEELRTEAESFGYAITVGLEAEVVTGGVLMGGGLAYSNSGSYTATTSSGTQVAGTLASLSSAYATQSDRFTWGLMAYPVQDATREQAYSVVTYWVDVD